MTGRSTRTSPGRYPSPGGRADPMPGTGTTKDENEEEYVGWIYDALRFAKAPCFIGLVAANFADPAPGRIPAIPAIREGGSFPFPLFQAQHHQSHLGIQAPHHARS